MVCGDDVMVIDDGGDYDVGTGDDDDDGDVTNLAGGRRDCGTMLRPSHIWAISLRQEGQHHDIFKARIVKSTFDQWSMIMLDAQPAVV